MAGTKDRSHLQEFKIIPILGRKTNVPQDDPSLFQFIGDTVALTHDVGGINFDLQRKRNACTKSEGKVQWSNSATAQATRCLGLFELYDGSNYDHIFFDNGKFYVYDSSLDPSDKTATGVTHATGVEDFYSIIKVGSYVVWADRAETTPYKWKHGDAAATKLIASGTEYMFRYLMPFQRRVIGLYSDQTNGDIDIRYSTDWPTTAITALNFPAANQLWVPNDDPIAGGATMGRNRAFVYCDNSIQEILYYPDYEAPFRVYTVVADQGAANHHSIVSVGNRHFLFNRSYGFCEYQGGSEFPFGGRPISENIETDLRDIASDHYRAIIGTFIPLKREICWTAPLGGEGSCTHLLFYNLDTKQWRFEDKAYRYVDHWQMYLPYTWNDLITELGGTGATWAAAGTHTWAYYTSMLQRLVYGGIDGHLYYQYGETLAGSALDGYRIEPIMSFGDAKRKDLLEEIWFDLATTGDYSIHIYHRGGDTTGEVEAASWTALDTLSHNSPDKPCIYPQITERLHQIKWRTDSGDEKFQVNGITFRFNPQRTT